MAQALDSFSSVCEWEPAVCLLNACFNLVPFLVTVIVTKKPQKQATAARRKQGNGSHLDGAARQLGSLSTKAENKRNDLELSVKGEC